jgi:hypothetical protein
MFEDKLKNNEERNHGRKAKVLKKEFILFLFDADGNVIFTVPLFGEFSDVIWAPMAYLMTRMYKGTAGGKWNW